MATAANINDYEVIYKLQGSVLTDEHTTPPLYLSKPKIQKCYAYHGVEDHSSDVRFPYFKLPKPCSYPIDLNKGFEQYIFRRDEKHSEMQEDLQKFIMESKVLQSRATEIANPAEGSHRSQQKSKRKLVLSNRGCLCKIMITPYRLKASEYNNNQFFATRYCDVLYISERKWKSRTSKNETYHYKFVQNCFSDDPDLDPNTNIPVNENEFIRGIFRSTIKEFDLLYSAEIAGIVSNHKIENFEDMENINNLKFINTKVLWNSGFMNIWKHPKSLLWWLQSYLSNSSDICVGLKDADGFIRKPVQLNQVKDIPRNQIWKPHICIRFLLTMLKLIETKMSSVNCPYTVYEFAYDSYTTCIKLKKHIGKTEYSFLSEEYIEHCRKQTSM